MACSCQVPSLTISLSGSGGRWRVLEESVIIPWSSWQWKLKLQRVAPAPSTRCLWRLWCLMVLAGAGAQGRAAGAADKPMDKLRHVELRLHPWHLSTVAQAPIWIGRTHGPWPVSWMGMGWGWPFISRVPLFAAARHWCCLSFGVVCCLVPSRLLLLPFLLTVNSFTAVIHSSAEVRSRHQQHHLAVDLALVPSGWSRRPFPPTGRLSHSFTANQ